MFRDATPPSALNGFAAHAGGCFLTLAMASRMLAVLGQGRYRGSNSLLVCPRGDRIGRGCELSVNSDSP